jgi:pyrroloquinoline-quinone synthase
MDRLDEIVARHDINLHPFYRAWRAGMLPRRALASYASDYAPFIHAVEEGWRSLGDEEHALTEERHALLWDVFRSEVEEAGTTIPSEEARRLVSEARRAFSDPVTAVGALYAFEAQQPKTAKSKLDGLVEHYELPEAALAYFRAHADDYGEKSSLSARAATLDAAGLARAECACESVARAMWSALDGVMRTDGTTSSTTG